MLKDMSRSTTTITTITIVAVVIIIVVVVVIIIYTLLIQQLPQYENCKVINDGSKLTIVYREEEDTKQSKAIQSGKVSASCIC